MINKASRNIKKERERYMKNKKYIQLLRQGKIRNLLRNYYDIISGGKK